MQPIEHMKGSEDELIAHIKESLTGHEEEYVPGSWENFNQIEGKRNAKVLWLWRLSSAAAVILIAGAAIILFTNKTTDVLPVQNVQHKQKETPAPSVKIEENIVKEADLPIAEKEHEQLAAVRERNNISVYTAAQEPLNTLSVSSTDAIAEKSNPVVVPSVRVPDTKQDIVKTETKPIATENKTTLFQEFLNNETKKNQGEVLAKSSAPRKEDKWEMGLVVSPSFGNTKKLNMGYGVSMGYALSDKISLNSGVSYSEMAASRSLPAPVSTAIAGESKNLESIEAKVTGIDIPLELKYRLSKNLYANVGVSAFAVINQKQSNSYIQEKLVERAVSSGGDGLAELKTFAVNERVVEPAQDSEIKDGRYIGFYNFSFGYKQKISKNKAVSIEPFMKVPMKEVSKENLRLIGTGVRLKLDF
jgi:cytoskeletal protein RodZ